MNVGVVKETKPGEGRVALTPSNVRELVSLGSAVFVARGAGALSGYPDEAYATAGAAIVPDNAGVYAAGDFVVKVKEMTEAEVPHLASRHIVFTFLHARMFCDVNEKVLATGCTCLAYEEVRTDDGARLILAPMSEIAGKLGFLKAVEYLQTIRGGPGLLPVLVENVRPLSVLVLGGGVAGMGSAEVALALGNTVHVVELSAGRRAHIASAHPAMKVHESTEAEIRRLLPDMDVVLNTVPSPPHSETHLITREMLGLMKRSAMIVDVACDVAGGVETCRPTTHADPVYEVDGIRHYCVDNIPGAVAATSTRALTAVTFPYIRAIATKGLARAVADDPTLARAVVFSGGNVAHADFAQLLGVLCHDPAEVVSSGAT